MASTRLLLFDDARARRWEPFSLTRPVGELLFGCLSQRERLERFAEAACMGHLAGPRLDGFDEAGSPPGVLSEGTDVASIRLLLNSRFVPEATAPVEFPTDCPGVLMCGEQCVGWIVPAGTPTPPEADLLEPSTEAVEGAGRRSVPLEGRLLEWPWTAMARNPDRIAADIEILHPGATHDLPPGVRRVGEGKVSLGADVLIEPGVILDTRLGPLRLEDGVRVQAPARIEGPTWVGRDSTILGGVVSRCTIGPVCRIRGEADTSLVLGYANKAHDGYLGHAYLGRWVNLGAMTTNSDLKNNYGPVRVRTSRGLQETDLLKVGCFLGDHVKTAIGTLLGTGSLVGPGSNVLGGGLAPGYVPPFSWGGTHGLTDHRLEAFLESAAAAMARRDVELTPGLEAVLRRAWKETRPREGQAGA